MDIHEKENLYLLSKQKYYEGNPIISDFEFDTLEEDLKKVGSQVTKLVGSQSLKDAKFNHSSPMLSLSKIQVNNDIDLAIESFQKWFFKNKIDDVFLEATPKFDGSSCNLIYEDGNLEWALTRGDKHKGQNIIEKMKHFVPLKINTKDKIEIRGEVVIPTKVFEKKYSHIYKNPRNFVAGILGRDIIESSIVSDFHFVAFEVKVHKNNSYNYHEDTNLFLKSNLFTISPLIKKFDWTDFSSMYNQMLNFRENKSPYQLDGIVIKFPEYDRNKIGESGYSPNWAVAIKFPPKESITTIKSINWSPGLSGEFTPIASLDPVDLDGTIVSNVNLHNYGNVINKGLFPGAKVIIVKSGDIIPIVKKVIERSDSNIELPTCSSSECDIKIENKIHLVCKNPDCKYKKINQLSRGIGSFGFRNVAGSTIKKLYAAGIKNILEVFDNTKFNEINLIKSGYFKKGRQLEILMQSRNNPSNKIILPRVITALSFDNVGWSTAVQISKLFEGKIPNWSGLNSAAYKPFLDNTSKEYKKVLSFIEVLESNGFDIQKEQEKIISKDAIKFEMTGSPKEFGFKKKSEFIEKIGEKGWIHHKLDKTCNYLITDDVNGNSSKIKKAKILGIEIISYEDALKK